MAIEYVDAAEGLERGIPTEETPVFKIGQFITRPANPRQLTRNSLGAVDGFITNYEPSVTVQFSGQVIVPAGRAEAANSSVLSADYKTSLNNGLTEALKNHYLHAFTTGDIHHGIAVVDFFLDEIEYTSDNEEILTFQGTATGWPGVTYTPPGP